MKREGSFKLAQSLGVSMSLCFYWFRSIASSLRFHCLMIALCCQSILILLCTRVGHEHTETGTLAVRNHKIGTLCNTQPLTLTCCIKFHFFWANNLVFVWFATYRSCQKWLAYVICEYTIPTYFILQWNVNPVHRGHNFDIQIMVFVDRWSL